MTQVNYATARIDSGEIVRYGHCSDVDFSGQAMFGEVAIEGAFTPATHYVADGEAVAYTSEQAALKANRPSYLHSWSNATMQWVDPRGLDDIKAERWERVKAARELAEFGGFTWDGSTFDSDPESQSRIQGAAQLATLAMLGGTPFAIDWTLADNTIRTLSGADVLGVGTALGTHIGTVHATGRALRAQIAAATTVEEVEAIHW